MPKTSQKTTTTKVTSGTSGSGLISRLRNRHKTTTTTTTTHTSRQPNASAGNVKKNRFSRSSAATPNNATNGGGFGGHNILRRPVNSNPAVHSHSSRTQPRQQQRQPGVGDKVSGAMMRLKGNLTGRPGLKAAGTRRENGTDGRGATRV